MYILLFCLLKDGDIDFILAPAVGSLTTAATGTGQGPSTSTIPGENLYYFICLGIWVSTDPHLISKILSWLENYLSELDLPYISEIVCMIIHIIMNRVVKCVNVFKFSIMKLLIYYGY